MSLNGKLVALGFEYEDYSLRQGDDGIVFIEEWYSQSPQPTQAQIDAVTEQQAIDALDERRVRQSFELSKKDKVLIKWIAQRTGGGTAQSIKAELKAIWENTN